MRDHDHDHHHHDHDGGGPHRHPAAPDIRLSDRARRALAMHELLIERGIVGPEDVRKSIDAATGNPTNGARLVAKAWVDPAFKQRLLADAVSTIRELGYEFPADTGLVVLENTPNIHHVIVCTLCSCYPGALLGPPPDWYKSLPYRSRAVIDPRGVMREFGFEPDDEVEVRVMDSTAELRYMVLPLRPAGSEGMTEEELAQLVVRDSMIGVRSALDPHGVPVGAAD
jgi:nitrile hydratase